MLEFAMTPEQRQRCSGIINGAIEVPFRCSIEPDRISWSNSRLIITGNMAVLSIKLTDDQLLSMLKQLSAKTGALYNTCSGLIADITGLVEG